MTNDDTQPQQHPQVAPEASRFKLTLPAKGLLQYEVSFGYATRADMLAHAVSDAQKFDAAIRDAFPNVVPAAQSRNGGD